LKAIERKGFTKLSKSRRQKAKSGDPAFMDVAVQLSITKMLKGFGGPFGAVVVHDAQIVASGFNQVTTRNDPTAHAEVVAIRRACKKLKAFHLTDCQLYTNCEPCPMCLGAIYWARLDSVFYALTRRDAAMIGFADEFIYEEIAKNPERRSIPMNQLSNSKAREAFRRWTANTSRVPY
jgi:guanine deaminase